jgi:hypothetical protein
VTYLSLSACVGYREDILHSMVATFYSGEDTMLEVRA